MHRTKGRSRPTLMPLRRIFSHLCTMLIPEVRDAAAIITTRNAFDATPLQKECDALFAQRLQVNPLALRTNFWKNHFEWQAALACDALAGTILDFGCGSGHPDIMLARNGRTIHGVDASPVGIAIAHHALARESQRVRSRISFSCADITTELPISQLCDAAWSSHVFEHIADPGPILCGLARWVVPSAPLLISVPLGRAYDDPGHLNHFNTEDELRAFLDPHIRVEATSVDNDHHVVRALCRFP